MRKALIGFSLAAVAYSVAAQDSRELVLDQAPFRVSSAFWPNLHHVLWADAWSRRPDTEERDAGPLPEPLTGALTPEERRAWEAAVAYYDADVADLHPLFEMRSIRKAMIAAGTELSASGLDAAHHKVLIDAAPVYRKYWWQTHNAANRAWVAEPMSKVAALTPAVPERLATLYGVPWLTGSVRVDVIRVGNREGAFTSIDPPPAHITISSSAPALAEPWTAAEVLFHESSHAMAFPLMEAFALELRSQRKTSRDLWHVALFYMTGEVVRQALETRGVSYEPYLYKTGLFDRAWPHFKMPIETHWKPYIHGQVSREVAIRNVVAAATGTEMHLQAYVTDVVLRWGLLDGAAILILTLWSALTPRSTSRARHAIAVLVMVACLSLTVQVFRDTTANVLIHACAATLSLLGARVVVSNRRSLIVRIVSGVILSAIGYAAGRGAALLLI